MIDKIKISHKSPKRERNLDLEVGKLKKLHQTSIILF